MKCGDGLGEKGSGLLGREQWCYIQYRVADFVWLCAFSCADVVVVC